MSLILDALRRAERERQLGHTPDLAQVTQAPQGPQRPRRVWVVGGVLGAGLVVLLMVLLPPARKPAEPAVVALVSALPAPMPAPAVPASAPAAVAGADVVRLEDLTDPAQSDEPALEGAPAEQAAEETPAIAAPEELLQEPADLGPGEKRLRDMPSTYRSDFPVLNVDVHVYDTKRARRWVMVNGRRYREGEKLNEGPQIAEIVEDGIVFDYRGEQVLYPSNP